MAAAASGEPETMWEQTKRQILAVANKDIPILLKSHKYNFFGHYTVHGPYFQREGNTRYYSEANLIHNAEVGRLVSGLSKNVFYLIKPVNVPETKGTLKNAFDRVGNFFREERPRWVREEAYVPESRLGSFDMMELSKKELEAYKRTKSRSRRSSRKLCRKTRKLGKH